MVYFWDNVFWQLIDDFRTHLTVKLNGIYGRGFYYVKASFIKDLKAFPEVSVRSRPLLLHLQ